MKCFRMLALFAATLLSSSPACAQHAGDIIMGSTQKGKGPLTVQYDFSRIVRVAPSFAAGGVVLYSATDPGFDALIHDDPTVPIFALSNGTPVRVQITAVDDGVSMKISGLTLDAGGKSAPIGTMPSLHNHPEWHLTLPDGVFVTRYLYFKLTTTAHGYSESVEYRVTITNMAADVTATPTATATLVATATPTETPVPTDTPTPPDAPTSTWTPTQISFSVTPSHTATVTRTIPPAPSSTPTVTESVTPTTTATPSQTTTPSPTPPATASLTASPAPTPSSTATSTASPTTTASPTPGPGTPDTNCDGKVSAADLTAVMRRLNGLQSSCSSDANGDGRIDDVDLMTVTRSMFGGASR